MSERFVDWTSAAKRFLGFVAKQPDGCTVWTGGRDYGGYGHFWFAGKTRLAHRWAWELRHGPLKKGLTIDHLCRNRACVRWDHLEAVPIKVNHLRAPSVITTINGAKMHCSKGHEYTPETVYFWRRHRQCRTCKVEWTRQWRERKAVML